MSSKFVKISSLQGVSNIQDGNLLDFIVPSNSYYNLSNSYLSLMAKVNTTENTTFDPTNKKGIHAVSVVAKDNVPYKNNVLIGDYRITSDKVVDIENLQSSNVINVNMDAYARDFEQIKSEAYMSLCSQYKEPDFSVSETHVGNFRTLSQKQSSTENLMEIKVPLNSISSFCNTQVYDTNRFGRTQMKVQMDLSKFSLQEFNPWPIYDEYHTANNCAVNAVQLVSIGLGAYIAGWDFKPGDSIQIEFIQNAAQRTETRVITAVVYTDDNNGTFTLTLDATPFTYGGDATNIGYWKVFDSIPCDNIPAVAANENITQLTSSTLYTQEKIRALKQRIGSKITVKAIGCAAIVGYINNHITNIETVSPYSALSKIKITLQTPFQHVAAENITDIVVSTYQQRLDVNPIADPGPAGADITRYTISQQMLVKNCGLWNGEKILVRGAFPDGSIGYYTTVKALEQVGNSVVVVVNDLFHLNNTQTITDIRIQTVGVDDAERFKGIIGLPPSVYGTKTLELYNPTMVLHELYPSHRQVKAYSSQPNKQLQYSYWKTECVNIPTGTANFVRLFQVDGSCRNAFAIIKKTDNLLSVADNLGSYRWRINNYDKTLRDIVVDSSLEQDNIIATMNNSDIVSLRSVQSLQKQYGDFGDFIVIPMSSVPMDGLQKTLMLTLNYSTPTGSDKILYLAKECMGILSL